MFSTGVRAWTLWMVLKTNPPPGAKISQRSSTCLADLAGRAERQHLLRVDAAAPERDAARRKSFLSCSGLHAGGRALHGVEDVEAGLDELRR